MQLDLHRYDDGSHEFRNIRTIEIEGQLWFVGNDVAKTLGYSNTQDAIVRHCKSTGIVKHDIQTDNKIQPIQSMVLINEPNVYRLIVRSQLPSAEKFEAWLFEEVVPSIRKKGHYGKIDRSALPNFIERYKDNYHKIDPNYFSIITEMFGRLYSLLESVGYVIPDKGTHNKKLMPDISVGRGFADFLRDNAPEFIDTCKTYKHTFPDNREVDANMYPIDALPLFIRYLNEVWIPYKAQAYFRGKDDLALEYLPKLLKG